MNEKWQAISREAGIAAEHMAIGVTALGRANYAQHAWYGQAFFALSIGMERAAKLALTVDHAVQNQGRFPENRQLREYGHNLKALLGCVDAMVESGRLGDDVVRLPDSEIHQSVIEILSDFASNITRYYNLDVVTEAAGVSNKTDPIAAWFQCVTLPIIKSHATEAQFSRVTRGARLAELLLEPVAMVIHHAETGDSLDTVFDASLQTGLTELAAPYVRLYTMQIIRFISHAISELGYLAHAAKLEDVPYLSEFFAIFNNEDSYLKSRKTWSIYRP
ncbi:hypothetical protein [Burkholderia pseudomallei]|uniref:hypothetical protein n=1 Tax=Burkholderia pseudomallei TaxID=28450 RepID=UPI0005369EBA|nr:hypothetical protein [Burkholderia pseudomallei]KGV57525.1 hypothetical protein X900_1351 [Burkholderia pseudomallei BDU 2]